MEKVKCVKCGTIGYTASPEMVDCAVCGGKHKIVRMSSRVSKIRKTDYLERLCKGGRLQCAF